MDRSRILSRLSEDVYDLVIIGGGIYGAYAAWDASLRGLSVALVEKGDFAGATSSQHFKMVHGGIRYLQHVDLIRIRESIRERRAFLRTAPHLVDPLPIVIPTYKSSFLNGKYLLGLGMFVYDLIAFDRNRGIVSRKKQIPRGRLLSRSEVLNMFPDIQPEGLTGAALFHDAQMYNSSRVVMSLIRGAAENGASVCNYMPARKFILDNNRVTGIEAEDLASGKSIGIRGKVVLNAAGPWAHWLLRENLGIELNPGVNFSRDTCFLVKRKLSDRYVLAVMGQTRDPDSIVSREARHLFIVPWRNYSLVGVWHVVKPEKPEDVTATRAEIETYIEEVNAAYPGLNINYDEITVCNWGLTLFGENEPGKKDLSYGKRSRLIDHENEDNIKGLISLIGVRATASRGMAAKAVDQVLKKISGPRIHSKTGSTPIWGGNVRDFSEYMEEQFRSCPVEFEKPVFLSLLRNYGSKYMDVVKYAMEQPQLAETFEGTNVIKAEVLYAATQEMAHSLSDVVLRRTELGSGGNPGHEILMQCADLLGDELGWDKEQRKNEIDKLIGCYPNISG